MRVLESQDIDGSWYHEGSFRTKQQVGEWVRQMYAKNHPHRYRKFRMLTVTRHGITAMTNNVKLYF